MASIPHLVGQNATLVFFIDGSPAGEFDCKSWKVDRNVTEINDGVCGENRDRLDAITNFFTLDFECFSRTAKLLNTLLADQAQDDAGGAPSNKAVGFILRPRDGSRQGYQAREVTTGAWGIGAGGRTDRAMCKVPMRARYFDLVGL